MRPLFSLATANPEDGLQLGQIADVDGSGSTFVMEDLGVDGKSDRDYNDIIFQFKGATGEAIELEEVITPEEDWRETETGEALLDYVEFDGEEVEVATTLPEPVQTSLARAVNLDVYNPEALAETTKWVVGVSSSDISPDILTLLDASNLGETGHIPNTHIWQFNEEVSSYQVQQRLSNLNGVEFAYPLVQHQHSLRSLPDDTPLWHLHNTVNNVGTAGTDLNVLGVWDDGIKGEGVTVAIVDNGVKYDHVNLTGNYRPDLSRDFAEVNNGVYDVDPKPLSRKILGPILWDSHGTRMAGIVAGTGENDTFGVAPDASLIALRQFTSLDPTSNDLVEADSLSYLHDDVDIYSNSWGPDSGKSSEPLILGNPDPLTMMELHTGVNQGRNGLGSIFVWAGGNDGELGDNVNYDGYANSRYTIAVGAVDYNGFHLEYSEEGAALLVAAYSGSFTQSNSGIYTTDIAEPQGFPPTTDYTNKVRGTSTAAAMVSGVVALMLEANPALTWRDVQHILVETSQKTDPNNGGWQANAAGYEHSYKYGFGIVDAAAAVNAAKNWQAVGTEVSLEYDANLNQAGFQPQEINQTISDDGTVLTSTITIDEEITVESAEVVFDATHGHRGDLEVVLISPDDTESILAEPYKRDGENYSTWKFTSLRHWGESSKGNWTLQVTDTEDNSKEGIWNSWRLNLHGAKPMIAIEASDPDASEDGDRGEFTITRSGSTKHSLTVNYDIWEAVRWSRPKANPGVDYEKISTSVTFEPGQSSVTITIQPKEDTRAEWPETVRLKLAEDSNYEVSPNNIDTVTIWDDEKPSIRLLTEWYNGQPTDFHQAAYTSESGNQESLHLRRTGRMDQDVTVFYSLPGNATNGEDYEELSGEITIPANVHDFHFDFIPIDDNEEEGDETLELILDPNPNYTFAEYQGKVWDRIPITIGDNDNKPAVEIIPNQDSVSEYADSVQVTVTRTGNIDEPLTVEYWIATGWRWRAKNGEDYEEIPDTITIPAGEASATINIKLIDDNLIEDREKIDLYLKTNPAYSIGAKQQARINIDDNDSPQEQWRRQFGTDKLDLAKDLALDKDDNIYATGRTTGDLDGENQGIGDIFLVKYNSSGTEQWKRQLGTNGFDEANGVATDSTGNVYLTGWTDGSLDNNGVGRCDAWLSKYDSNGNWQWDKQIGTPQYDISNGAMTADSQGNVYITGYTYGNLGGEGNQGQADVWFAKYDSNGNQKWVKQLGSSGWDEAQDIAVDNQGNIYLTGHTNGTLGDTSAGDKDAWVAKYNSSGDQEWVKQLGTVTNEEALGIAIDKQDFLYLSGHTNGWLGEAYPGKPDDWLGDYYAWWQGIHGDKRGLGGTYQGNGDAWVAQFDLAGNRNWTRLIGTTEADIATSVAVDKGGNVYLTGSTRGEIVKDGQLGGSDAFVAKYNVDGALHWKQQLGTAGEDTANSLAIGNEGIYLTGSTSGDFDGNNQGGDDIWIAKFA